MIHKPVRDCAIGLHMISFNPFFLFVPSFLPSYIHSVILPFTAHIFFVYFVRSLFFFACLCVFVFFSRRNLRFA